jgi:hypothetical protein
MSPLNRNGHLANIFFSGCQNREIGWPIFFVGLIIGTTFYFGADSATRNNCPPPPVQVSEPLVDDVLIQYPPGVIKLGTLRSRFANISESPEFDQLVAKIADWLKVVKGTGRRIVYSSRWCRKQSLFYSLKSWQNLTKNNTGADLGRGRELRTRFGWVASLGGAIRTKVGTYSYYSTFEQECSSLFGQTQKIMTRLERTFVGTLVSFRFLPTSSVVLAIARIHNKRHTKI